MNEHRPRVANTSATIIGFGEGDNRRFVDFLQQMNAVNEAPTLE
jgi:hypothetical protein